MDLQLIDVSTLFLLFLVLSAITSNTMYDENTNKNNFAAYKGLFALLILFHHVSQRFEVTYFSIYRYVGSLIVGGFLLLSGFGLMRSYMVKGKKYFTGYFVDKIIILLIPWVICWCINTIIPLIIAGQPKYFFGISWFIFCMVFMYTGFYFAFNNNFQFFIKCAIMALVVISYFIIVLIMIKNEISTPVLSSVGNWWLYPVPTFLLGIIWARYQERINHIMDNKKIVSISIIGLTLILNMAMRNGKYLTASWIIADLSFAVLLIITISHINLKNKILIKLGKHSLEFFVIHTLFMTMFLFEPVKIDKVEYYLAAIIVCTVILMIPTRYIIEKYRNMVKKYYDRMNKKEEES